jgi:hypothetical protein
MSLDHFQCPRCRELFDAPVWHCLHCDHHWPLYRDTCQNCNEGSIREWVVFLAMGLGRAILDADDGGDSIVRFINDKLQEAGSPYRVVPRTLPA